MNQEQIERIMYMAQAAKEADIMLVIDPEAVIDLMDNLRASIELTAIREEQLQDEFKEVERLQLSFAFQCHIGNLSLAQTATALNMNQDEVMELTRKLPSPVSPGQANQEVEK